MIKHVIKDEYDGVVNVPFTEEGALNGDMIFETRQAAQKVLDEESEKFGIGEYHLAVRVS
jgi:hypothetical protein